MVFCGQEKGKLLALRQLIGEVGRCRLTLSNTKLTPPGTKRLKLKRDILLSTSAFKFDLRRYSEGIKPPIIVFTQSKDRARQLAKAGAFQTPLATS